MGADEAIDLMKRLLWQTGLVSGPILIAALLVGVLISVLQVATQLQEMTLSYIPKLIVTAFVLLTLGPWMIHQITEFAVSILRLMASVR